MSNSSQVIGKVSTRDSGSGDFDDSKGVTLPYKAFPLKVNSRCVVAIVAVRVYS